MSSKKDLRRKLKTILSSISENDHHQLSLLVSQKLTEFLNDQKVIHKKKLVIGVFAPIQKEPDWFLAIDETKIQTAYPAYANDRMIFKLARMSELINRTDFGVKILGPAENATAVTPDLIIVPGLGFSKDGKRLGRGKGFYDRCLEHSSAVKIGIAFEMQIEEDIPTDEHDIQMDFVVTDKDIYKKELRA
ncbi:MAG: 5-formyltetrahydrofolate cyclo-ligase [Bacteriovorax sp.]|nr:5-formyltetrahydrofolate cyclo-ligase [Bacteriovorax sp.]